MPSSKYCAQVGTERQDMEESPQILRFNEIPSAEEFTSQIEPKNVPAVFTGCLKDWKAISKWNVSNGGLEYLQERAGSSIVDAMVSRSAPVFYGDIRSHERVPLPFATFVGYCKDLLRHEDDDSRDSEKHLRSHRTQHEDSSNSGEDPQQIYLAQVPIFSTENEEKTQLECLKEDIETPVFLEGKVLASVNLWMNNARSRSSTHYDPHHNLLCTISGTKQVILWPPSASPLLYPMPLYGESSNHSAVSLENPNFGLYPRAERLYDYSQKVTLQAGDALFIPEGWFHQVDSGSVTIAVNFWWQSEMLSGMLQHMDSYYLRRILKRLTDKEMDRMMCMHSTAVGGKVSHSSAQSNNATADHCDQDLDLNNQKVRLTGQNFEESLYELEPNALQSLHKLVSLIHDRVDQSLLVRNTNTSADPSVTGEEAVVKEITKTNLMNLGEDPIATVISNLQPHTFKSVFLVMAYKFPKTLEAFVLHALSPVGTEALTRKFEQLDQIIDADDRSLFYQKFYSVFDNESSAMEALLNGKELFAHQAYKNVLVQYLGINIDGPKPLVS